MTEIHSTVPLSWEEAISQLPASIQNYIRRNEPLSRHTTFRVGGPADYFLEAHALDQLAAVSELAQQHGLPLFVLGEGSNLCVSDRGVRGFVLRNCCRNAEVGPVTRADSGHNFMRLFQKALAASLSGLEFAVGIPGTLGGALVSNAGAYRANICDLVTGLEVVSEGERKTVGPEWMEFRYRDSRLRHPDARLACLLSVSLYLKPDEKTAIRLRAREFQLQRIRKQPWHPSAGSFFKNVYDARLAEELPTLSPGMKHAGVVPAAYLAEACGCKGLQIGNAAISPKHANFIVNLGDAAASDIRAVANEVRRRVLERFGVRLEEEALYLGDWEPQDHDIPAN